MGLRCPGLVRGARVSAVVAVTLVTSLVGACSGASGGELSTAEPAAGDRQPGPHTAIGPGVPTTSPTTNPLARELRGQGWYCYRAESVTSGGVDRVEPCERDERECQRLEREHARQRTVTPCRFQARALCLRGRHIATQNEVIACFQTAENCTSAYEFMLYGPDDDPKNREYEFVTECHVIE